MNIDAHFHCIPPEYLSCLRNSGRSLFRETLIENGAERRIQTAAGSFPVPDTFTHPDAVLRHMDSMKLDKAFLSVPPFLFGYERSVPEGILLSQTLNQWILNLSAQFPDRLLPMGNLPMQDTEAAMEELQRCSEQGMRFFQIGSSMEGHLYDDERFLPFFQECSRRKAVLLLHPYFSGRGEWASRYYLSNLCGYPMETTFGCISMIFGGVFDHAPNLRIIACHGGGAFPYLFGRFCHGYQMRNEPKSCCLRSPEFYLKHFYFDTMIFRREQLRFLVEFAGAGHVVLGTDHGFDMGMENPVDFVKSAGFSSEDTQKILGENLLSLLS